MAEILRLSASDIAKMRALNALFAEAFEDPHNYSLHAPTDAYLAEKMSQPQNIVLAACDDEQVIGGLVGYELAKFEQARSEIYIYDLAVAKSHRRHGIATALIAETRRIAQMRGAWAVFVQADYGDEPAVALYTKLGTREDVIHFDIDVTEAKTI